MRGPLRSLGGLARRLAACWWPQLAALAAATAIVAVTITGALGVGDAIRSGLRELALGRLGRIDAAVLGEGFFRRGLADDLAASLADEPWRPTCTPALVLPATLAATQPVATAARTTMLACDDPAALGFVPPPPPLDGHAVLVNRPLATALGVTVGDAVVLRLPKRSAVPADSPLGRREAESLGRRMRVAAVLPEAGMGRFSLRPTQASEPLALISLADAQAILREGDVANAILVVGSGTAPVDAATITARLRPSLDDHGLAFAPVDTPSDAEVLRLTSRRLMIPPEIDRAARDVLAAEGGRATLAFLANEIAPYEPSGGEPKARVPYSTVLGIDTTALPGGGLVDASGARLDVPLDDEIILDRWVADDLAAQGRTVGPGELVVITAFMPETIHGRVEERTETFRVAGIAEMEGAAVDRSLVPEVEGVTDEDSIADWDPPFPFDAARVRTVPPHDEDDRYWKTYRATPKAFVSLAAARRIAGGRFGASTAWHVAAADRSPPRDDLAGRLAAAIDPARSGIKVAPVRAEAEAAAQGSTPFGLLFLALSSFVVAAGLLLIWLLFGLLVAARSTTLGLLAALGFAPRRVAVLLLSAVAAAAVFGAALGTAAGPLWSRLLVTALGRAWDRDVAAGTASMFSAATVSVSSAVGGALATVVMALAAVAIASLRAGHLPPLALLRGTGPATTGRLPTRRTWLVAVTAVATACAAAAAAHGMPSSALGLFFAAGFAALVGLMALVRLFLGLRDRHPLRSLWQLAARGVAARPARGFAIASIVACGQFLIVAVSAFALRPPTDPGDRASPTGGWSTIVTLGEPTSVDPGDAATRQALGLSSAQATSLAAATIVRLRSSDGDDASCTNLYATRQPAVLGVGRAFVERGGFRFVGHEPLDAEASGNPWRLIDRLDWNADPAIPAILDQATAQWGLRLGGVGSRFLLSDDQGKPTEFRIVGLLEPGILQGRVIVAEAAFARLFPSRSGYAMALVDHSQLDAASRERLPDAIRTAWADAGVSLESTIDRLRSLQAVQNTFLAGFQMLGTLGLLLGTAGVAAAQLQGVVERLRGLAVLRAVGFSLSRVRSLLAIETLVTVGLGVAAGTLAGSLAVWPALVGGTARVPLAWIAVSGGLTLLAAAVAGWLATARTAIPERPTSG